MRVKMKRCISCKTLLSNSSKVCTKCGSRELEKGVYTDESNNRVINNNQLKENRNIISCPSCGAGGISISANGSGECSHCGDEITVYNNRHEGSYYMDFIDRATKK